MPEPQIRVTVEDLATGETESQEIRDDYIIVCAGTCHVDGIQTYPTKGTHVLTVKGRRERMGSPADDGATS